MLKSRSILVLLALALTGPATASAQTVVVRVMAEETSMPVFGALAYLVDPGGRTVRNGLTDERGRALFVGIAAGPYRVRVEMIGLATHETDLFEVGDGMSVAQDVRLASSAIQLEGIEVEADGGRCRLRPGGEGLAIADVWNEARKALTAAALTEDQGTYRYETMTYERRLDRNFTVLDESENRREGYMRTPFESRPAEDLVQNGFVQRAGRDNVYYAPDANVLLSDPFLDTHCFRLARGSGATEGLLGLAFEPTGENRGIVDIHGTMWLDAESAELQWLEFGYQGLDPDVQSDDIGGRVDFRRMPAGTWIVPEWYIRMPVVAQQRDRLDRMTRFVAGYLQSGGVVEDIREAGGRRLGQRVQTGGFEGIVLDSVGTPIPGVRVGVVGSSQEVFTNGEGRYSITGVSPGRYQVRFVDPTLELVGFVPPPTPKDVIRGELTQLDYHMPSIGDVLFDMCRGEEQPEGSVILAGVVTDGRRRPVVGATVQVSWIEYDIRSLDDLTGAASRRGGGRAGLEQSDGFSATTDGAGFYRFCGVPTDMRVEVVGLYGDEQSETYEVRVARDRFAVLRPITIGN